jgi:ferrous iron transport protein A
MTLIDCAAGDEVLLRRVTGDTADRRRLIELGLVAGTTVRLVSRAPGGAVVVAVGDGRVGLDARTAARLFVERAA